MTRQASILLVSLLTPSFLHAARPNDSTMTDSKGHLCCVSDPQRRGSAPWAQGAQEQLTCVEKIQENGEPLDFVVAMATKTFTTDPDSVIIHVSDGHGFSQTLVSDGSYLIPYHCLVSEDMNFDGYKDLSIDLSAGSNASYAQYWLYDPARHRFAESALLKTLPNVTRNPNKKTLATFRDEDSAGYHREFYRWQGKQLKQVGAVRVTHDSNGYQRSVYAIKDGHRRLLKSQHSTKKIFDEDQRRQEDDDLPW